MAAAATAPKAEQPDVRRGKSGKRDAVHRHRGVAVSPKGGGKSHLDAAQMSREDARLRELGTTAGKSPMIPHSEGPRAVTRPETDGRRVGAGAGGGGAQRRGASVS